MTKFILFLVTSLLSWLSISQNFARTQSISESPYRDNFCFLEIPELTNKLLKDLPNYANRVIQRTQTSHQNSGIDTYVIDAGKPEFEPLPLPQIQYSSNSSNGINQIFFTILERQYSNNRKLERQSYYWLFLIPTTQGWQMMMLFSRFGDNNQNSPPTPPQENSNGIIGQAVNLWLKDCRARTIH